MSQGRLCSLLPSAKRFPHPSCPNGQKTLQFHLQIKVQRIIALPALWDVPLLQKKWQGDEPARGTNHHLTYQIYWAAFVGSILSCAEKLWKNAYCKIHLIEFAVILTFKIAKSRRNCYVEPSKWVPHEVPFQLWCCLRRKLPFFGSRQCGSSLGFGTQPCLV